MLPKNTKLGLLTFGKIYVDYDGPQLFSCVSEDGRIFLVVHAPEVGDRDNWLYVDISPERLSSVELGLLTLREAFAQPANDTVHVVSIKPNGRASVSSRAASNVDSSWYPDEGERLSGPPTSHAVPIEAIAQTGSNIFLGNARLDLVPGFLVDPPLMWEIDPTILAYLRSRRTPVEYVAERTGRSVVDLMFNRDEHRTELPVATLGNLLSSIQRAVDGLVPELPAGAKSALQGRLPV